MIWFWAVILGLLSIFYRSQTLFSVPWNLFKHDAQSQCLACCDSGRSGDAVMGLPLVFILQTRRSPASAFQELGLKVSNDDYFHLSCGYLCCFQAFLTEGECALDVSNYG
ncbi:hypothetical protein LEMLEM_LOCUS22171, partial [Lemmus lemmus]